MSDAGWSDECLVSGGVVVTDTPTRSQAPSSQRTPQAIDVTALAGLEERLVTLLHALSAKQDELRRDVTGLQSSVSAIAAATAAATIMRTATPAPAVPTPAKDAAGCCSSISTPAGTTSSSSATAGPSTALVRAAAESDITPEDSSPSQCAWPSKPSSGSTQAAVSPEASWALLEGDADLQPMLKDMRGKINDYADRTQRKQPQMADLEAEGTLYVQLLRAKGLLAADSNGFSDPYAKLSLGEQKQRSRTIRKTLNPVWNSEIFAFYGVLGQLM